uniref:DUF4200 domain-containing protein n=1 Tax=Hippocampus comes TaxID=109280 RepID=A0A3Q2YKY2_HIPCM
PFPQISLMTKRSEICKMNKAITKEERRLKELEEVIEKDNESFAAFLRENEKKSLEAQTFFEREAKSKEEKTAEIQKLTSEISTIRSEVGNYEEILQEYKRYRELLFQLSPPEWQEAQRAKLLNNVHLDKNPEEDSTFKQSKKNTFPDESNIAGAQPRQFSAESARSSPHADNPELYFTDPKQLIELMTELTEQNLSLIKNSTRAEETLEELTNEKEKELLTRQIDDMNKQIEEEKTRASKLKKKVQLHFLDLPALSQDDMMNALGEKVSEVYRCCVGDGSSSHSTLEKLASIEKQMSLLLHCLEDIPKASLETMQKIKDSERRTRYVFCNRDLLQREKQIERMKRYLERSLSDTKKTVSHLNFAIHLFFFFFTSYTLTHIVSVELLWSHPLLHRSSLFAGSVHLGFFFFILLILRIIRYVTGLCGDQFSTPTVTADEHNNKCEPGGKKCVKDRDHPKFGNISHMMKES